jgi:hypothetical protein
LADAHVAKVASQVRHDIQGALMIANSAISRIEDHHDEIRILKASLDRVKSTIKDIPKIANLNDGDFERLSNGDKELSQESNTLESCHLLSIITQVVGDISLTNSSIEFVYTLPTQAEELYININYNRFERILFNLYKNAIESITTNGKIVTSVSISDGKVNLSINDNGIGMPEKVFKNLGQKGNTFGKASGTGLGIYDAYEQLKQWNADIYYQTEKDLGTTANLVFEVVNENPLFPSEILIPEDSTVVILDDDPSVHESWRQRFKTFQDNNISFKYFEKPSEATLEINELKSTGSDFLFLGDYDLRDKNINGLKFIEENDIIDHSVLVTSSIKAVLNECRVKQIPVISKSIQSTINIHTIS